MSKFSESNLSSRRNARRERVEPNPPPGVCDPTEEQARATARPDAVIKMTAAHYALPDHFTLEQQNRGVL